MRLRYGTNPEQTATATADRWPIRLRNGEPSYINLLDALNGWQLVQEASRLLDRPAAASFKHVSPAGAAVSGPLDEVISAQHRVTSVSAVASAYLRARDADPKSSYGDFAALSHPVDTDLAELLTGLVCDGIIAPGYEPGTVERLSRKKNGRFLIIEADPAFTPPVVEQREVFGVRLSQDRPEPLSALDAGLPADVLLGMAVARYTQSNSVCYVRDGMALGIGAGQQSRVDCTRLAGAKTDIWWLRRHPSVRALSFRPGIRRQDRLNWQIRYLEGDLTPDESTRLADALTEPATPLPASERTDWLRRLTGVTFVSDGALPFRDNVDQAARHGVRCIAEPGGSIRSAEVAEACRAHEITLIQTGVRLFHH